MELRQLRYLVAVARHGHVTRAADDVHVTQSALSQQIRRLEAELGLALLHRTPHGVELTPAGADLVARAERILNEVDAAQAEVLEHRGVVRGIVRVAATAAAAPALAPVLATFHRARPEVRLVVQQAAATDLPQLVARGSADLALGDPEDAGPGVAVEDLQREPLVLHGAEGGIAALRGRPVVLPAPGTRLRATIVAACEAEGFGPVGLLEASDPATVLALTSAGLGAAVVPRSWSPDGEALAGLTHAQRLLVPATGTSPAAQLLAEALRRGGERG